MRRIFSLLCWSSSHSSAKNALEHLHTHGSGHVTCHCYVSCESRLSNLLGFPISRRSWCHSVQRSLLVCSQTEQLPITTTSLQQTMQGQTTTGVHRTFRLGNSSSRYRQNSFSPSNSGLQSSKESHQLPLPHLLWPAPPPHLSISE